MHKRPPVVLLITLLLFVLPACLNSRSAALCSSHICFDESIYPGRPSTRTGGYPARDTAADTRACDAVGAIECPLRRDVWFDVEWTGPGVAAFQAAEFVDGRACKPVKELVFSLVTSDGTGYPGTVETLAEGNGSSEGGESSVYCGRYLLKFDVKTAALLLDGLAIQVRDIGPEAPTRNDPEIRFIWLNGN